MSYSLCFKNCVVFKRYTIDYRYRRYIFYPSVSVVNRYTLQQIIKINNYWICLLAIVPAALLVDDISCVFRRRWRTFNLVWVIIISSMKFNPCLVELWRLEGTGCLLWALDISSHQISKLYQPSNLCLMEQQTSTKNSDIL